MNVSKKKNRIRPNSGFTIGELLVAVAIIAVLFAILVSAVFDISKNIRQKELDAKAEIIYLAAQNRVAKLKASGKEEFYTAYLTPLGIVPIDADADMNEDTLYYADSSTRNSANCAATRIVPQSYVENELWENNWVIELNPESGSIYAVFYSEEPMRYTPESFDSLRIKKQRKKQGATIGYYGGDSVTVSTTDMLVPSIQIVNGEKLTAVFSCNTPDGSPLTFTITLRDDEGNKETVVPKVSRIGKIYEYEMVLDDLSGASTRFTSKFPKLSAGSDIDISLTVTSDSALIDAKTVEDSTNSLFDSVEDGTAIITYGRHLQNLDAASGVTSAITDAVQKSDLSFSDSVGDPEDWYSYYGANSFKPIENANLQSYSGKSMMDGKDSYTNIYNLTTKKNASRGGLFGKFSGTKLENIYLSGEETSALTDCGGLVGVIDSNCSVTDCHIYLNPTRGDTRNKDDKYVRISGQNAGGLIGLVTEGVTVNVTNCFAATVVGTGGTTAAAGGLIGNVLGKATVSNSYADCYLYGQITGGIAGGAADGSALTLKNCYAAGYQTGTIYASGFVSGKLAGASNAYTVMYYEDGCIGNIYSTAITGSVSGGVYYLRGGNNLSGTQALSYADLSDKSAFAAMLGSAFTASTGGNNTVAYKLKGQGLSDYSFPKLSGIVHYGDWEAEFESGTLVYYEKYTDGEYGFYGANKTTLSDTKTVAGDGYGIIFGDKSTNQIELEYETAMGNTTQKLDASKAFAITGNYYLLPLGVGISDIDYEPDGFYHRICLNGVTSYYNPHFAKTVTTGDEMPEPPQMVTIRTARQLYDMSKFYDIYAPVMEESTFYQETDLDYTQYDAAGFTVGGNIKKQRPIGMSDVLPFDAKYNGNYHTIKGVSFSAPGRYIGMFGCNLGDIENVFLANDTGSGVIAETTSIVQGAAFTLSMGTLTGHNRGSITNCASSGYSMNTNFYTNSVSYVGGLVGLNSGSVRNSEATFPRIVTETTYANAYLGGFVGNNKGSAYRCYAIGNILVDAARDGDVNISGFAGINEGVIHYAFCSTALNPAGSAKPFGFSPTSGAATECYYLHSGSYSYAGNLHSYNSVPEDTFGTPKTHMELSSAVVINGFGTADSGHSFLHSATEEESFPYPAVVTDSFGNYVHYGDWTTQADMGSVGIFYWEYEQGGSNEGYHFSYIGIDNDMSNVASSLCQAHNDGGMVTDFGYGYYKKANEKGTAALEKITGFGSMGDYDKDVSDAIAEQLAGYIFYAYKTGTDGKSHLYMNSNAQNGEMQISYTTAGNKYTYSFAFSPFFADAMQYKGVMSGTATVAPGASAGFGKYIYEPGTENNPYETRSVAQLQYINWNYSTLKTDTDVSSSTKDKFPYLHYTNLTGRGNQKYADATKNRPIRYWNQSHDLEGENGTFAPIAGTLERAGSASSYDVMMHAWFSGKYNGQNYTIKNIQVLDSKLTNVGIFGTTVGARLENMILYSDRGSVIERETTASDNGCAYTIGGLVGIAYEYVNDSIKEEFTNCAIAGYRIIDNSKNKQYVGETNIGGLVGASNVNLNSCSSVVDIEVNCTHPNSSDSKKITYADWGNFIRVGGIAGACRYNVTDCYSGGSISVGEATLQETADSNANKVSTSSASKCDSTKSTHVFVGGMGGSGFCSNFMNFTGSGSQTDGNPVYTNCYTYMTLPKLQGTIRAVSVIASVADRYQYANTLKINNCYYLSSITKGVIDKTYLPKYYFSGTASGNAYLYNNAINTKVLNESDMLAGEVRLLNRYINNGTDSSKINFNGLTPLTYKQMSQRIGLLSGDQIVKARSTDTKKYSTLSEALGNGFSWVTIEENGASVEGKYSFPGEDEALVGKNYPFPTILEQENSFGDTVNVHYGQWPKDVLNWQKGMAAMDMILSYDKDAKKSHTTLLLNLDGDSYTGGIPSFSVTDDLGEPISGMVDVTGCTYHKEEGYFAVDVTAYNIGAVRISATYGGVVSECMLNITAGIFAKANPVDIVLYEEDTATIALHATSAEIDGAANDVSAQCKWTMEMDNDRYIECSAPGVAADDSVTFKVTALGEGETRITAKAEYTLPNGNTYSGTTTVVVVVKKQGIIGACNAQLEKYNQVVIPPEIDKTEFTGVDTRYSASQISPAYEGGGLFLYATGTDVSMEKFTLERVLVTEEAGNSFLVINGDNTDYTRYSVVIGEPAADKNYSYLPVKISGVRTGRVTVNFVLSRDGVQYTVSIPYDIVKSNVTVYFADIDGLIFAEETIAFGGAPDISEAARADWTVPEPPIGYEYGDLSDPASWDPAATEGVYVDTVFRLKVKPITYYVEFVGGDQATGSMPTQKFTYNEPQALTLSDFVKKGHIFDGWSVSDGGILTYTDGQTVTNLASTHDATVRLYAKWTYVRYKVSFDPNGGMGTMASQEVDYDDDLTLRTNSFTRTDYAFDGWALTPGGDKVYSDGAVVRNLTNKPGKEIVLYAHWRKLYSVTYNGNGGSTPDGGMYDSGEEIVLPTSERTGYAFTGWSDGKTTYKAGERYTVSSNVTFTAQWTAETLTVTHKMTGCTQTTAVSKATYGTGVTVKYQASKANQSKWTVTVKIGGVDVTDQISKSTTTSLIVTKSTCTITIPGEIVTGKIEITASVSK